MWFNRFDFTESKSRDEGLIIAKQASRNQVKKR
jgi:hypothetical protein